jgi:predicted ATPase
MCAEAATPVLVAREAELGALRSAVEQAAAGRSTAVLVAGDAGVGKSRLVAALADEAGADGLLVLVGRCVDIGEGELPYAPIAAALRSLLVQLSSPDLDEVLGPARSELGRLVPDLAVADVAPLHAALESGERAVQEILQADSRPRAAAAAR